MFSKNRFIFILGFLVMLIPFMGLPSGYKSFFLIVLGIVIMVLAYMIARDRRIRGIEISNGRQNSVYAEHNPMISESKNNEAGKNGQ